MLTGPFYDFLSYFYKKKIMKSGCFPFLRPNQRHCLHNQPILSDYARLIYAKIKTCQIKLSLFVSFFFPIGEELGKYNEVWLSAILNRHFNLINAFLVRATHFFQTQHTQNIVKYYAGPIHYVLSFIKRIQVKIIEFSFQTF